MDVAVECLLPQKGNQVKFVGYLSLLLSLSLSLSGLRVCGDGDGDTDGNGVVWREVNCRGVVQVERYFLRAEDPLFALTSSFS